MKFTVQELFDLKKGLDEIGERKDTPVKLSFRLSLIAQKIKGEHESATRERDKIIKKYRNEEGTEIDRSRTEEFNADYDELAKQEVEIKHLKKIDISEFDVLETVKPNTLLKLNKVLTDGGDK